MSPSHWRWGLRLFPSCSWRWRSCPSIRAPPAPCCGPWAGRCSWGSRCRRWPRGAVTGIVAEVGAGGIQALRMDDPQNWRARAWAVSSGVGVHAGARAYRRCSGPAAGAHLPPRPSASPITSRNAGPSRRLAPEQVDSGARCGWSSTDGDAVAAAASRRGVRCRGWTQTGGRSGSRRRTHTVRR